MTYNWLPEDPWRQLSSSSTDGLLLHRRTFTATRSWVWNSLPKELHDEDMMFSNFRRELKTFWLKTTRAQCDIGLNVL